MSRLFAFGCSSTRYIWPTWADILGLEYDEFYNWGQGGAGNHFIFYTLVEAIERHKITSSDSVYIMWSSIGREDRFIKGDWFTPGSVYNGEYPQEYVEKFAEPDHFLLTSMTLIHSAYQLLKNIGCDYRFLKTVALSQVDDTWTKFLPFTNSFDHSVIALYKDSANLVETGIYEDIFPKDRMEIFIPHSSNYHKKDLKKKFTNLKGKDWPSFDNFYNRTLEGIKKPIIKELNDLGLIDWRERCYQRCNMHHVPIEHAEYLQNRNFILTNKQKEFVAYWDNIIRTQDTWDWPELQIKRFGRM